MTMDYIPRLIKSVDEISGQYDGFLIDQWGVLHDGVDIFPAALATLKRLKQAGKQIVILSNSGRSGLENESSMERMGIASTLYDRVLSAGDDAVDALTGNRDELYRDLGHQVWLFARS